MPGRDPAPGDPPSAADPRRRLPRDPGRAATGPNPRLQGNVPPPNVRVPNGPRAAGPSGPARPAARPGAGRGGTRPHRPPRRPSRWLTLKRAKPGRRIGITLLAIAVVMTLFAGRLVQLQGMESGYYKKLANKQKLSAISLAALRGTIYGADGQILAMTTETYTIWSDPTQIPKDMLTTVAAKAAGPLGMTAARVLYLLEHPPVISPQYVVLAKGVPSGKEITLASLNLAGIYADSPSFVRVYPNGDSTANVVGLTNTNLTTGVIGGYAGIEQEYNKLLTGTAGSEQVMIGTQGEPIPLAGTQVKPARDGDSIKLTIIPALQFAAQQACQQEVSKTKAENCSVVVMQPKTGAILAMAQWPNNADGSDIAATQVFEPGSTAKVITAAAALEHGGRTPMSTYNIPYRIYRGGQWIHDAEWSPGEKYTIAGIIANSSNVGMSQVAESVSPELQNDYLHNFGLYEYTGLNLPGESRGLLPALKTWPADERYTLSYGQGISTTAVQMASVYATIANAGVRVQPSLIAGTYNAAGNYTAARKSPSRRVIQAKTARQLIQILQQVPGVDDAAQQYWGEIPGYAIAAKTGTSSEPSSNPDKPCPKSNPLCIHGSSYIGMAPGNDPGVVVAVNVQDPQTKTDYFGDMVAGPVFYNVMKFALQTLQIQPQPGLVAPHVRLNAR
jgi:cell division protein FtsI (penicillin-binding protein 3)